MKRQEITLFIPTPYTTDGTITGGRNVKATVINEHFATNDDLLYKTRRVLTHRHTGRMICSTKSDAEAQRVVDRLMAIKDIDWSDPRVSYYYDEFKSHGPVIMEARIVR